MANQSGISIKADYKDLLPGVKHKIAVASGKGGVGKSTIAANLAISLAKKGYKVGLLDTDILGPSIAHMFGSDQKDVKVENEKMIPVEKYGVKFLSMGNLVPAGKATMWRGPMIHSAVQQMISEAVWGELDFFILDLPPGTGDIQLTIVQSLSLTGSIVVSTPQEVSLIDVKKCVDMFRQIKVPISGIVENMSYFVCDSCDKKHYLFGDGGAKKYAESENIALLAQLPMNKSIMQNAEIGTPYALSENDKVFVELSDRFIENISK